MSSLSEPYLRNLRFTAVQTAAMRALGEYRGRQQLFQRQRPEILSTLRSTAMIESSESSNRLEGIVAPRARVTGIVQKRLDPRNRSEQEIAGYRDALDLIHESARDMLFTVPVVLQLHSQLYRYLPSEGGRFKMADNEIIERDARGNVLRVRFLPVSAVATPGAMASLQSGYQAAWDREIADALILIPLAVLDFLCIHPFADGNGRVGRLITLMLLYHFDYQVGRYISLERIFEESRETYYETLEKSSRGWHDGAHDVHPWLDYFWGVLVRAYKEFEDRVGRIDNAPGSKSRRVRESIRSKTRPFRVTEIERECPGVSRETIRQVLRELRDKGEIVREGAGRGVRWRPVPITR